MCSDIRTRTAVPSGHSASVCWRWATIAAATPEGADLNAANMASPWQSTTTPSPAATASRSRPRCCLSTSGQPSPSRFRSAVDPSMSENISVTVPAGSSLMAGTVSRSTV